MKIHRTAYALILSLFVIPGCLQPVADDRPPQQWPVRLTQAPGAAQTHQPPVVLWTMTRIEPAPVAAYFLRIDLQHPQVEIIAMPAGDPDGDGPAEASLTRPLKLVEKHRAVAAVNCNGFAGLPGPDGKRSQRWHRGMPVDIIGLVVADGTMRSPADTEGNNLCFWTGKDGRPHIGKFPNDTPEVDEGCNAWWIDLVKDGRVLPRPGGKRHPRTALGLDKTGRWLLMVVVDGRQAGYSVGMTAHELAKLMLENGCHRAINLDGGGSSVMIAGDATGAPEVVTRPSGGKPRPLPVMLGVRRKTP